MHTIVSGVHLFDTCTNRCSYCHFAETGKVIDNSQIAPYRDPKFIDHLLYFFLYGVGSKYHWELVLTGGEPLLMPNLDRFVTGLVSKGNLVSFNTALNISGTNENFQFLLNLDPTKVGHIFASLHPDSDDDEEYFFKRVKLLKERGHAVIVRYVCHPARLNRLEVLEKKCRRIDVAFSPSAMISPSYPQGYSEYQRQLIESHLTSVGQLIQLRGGLDTKVTKCLAGSHLLGMDFRTGNISVCSTIPDNVIGNIFDNLMTIKTTPIACPKTGEISCNCNLYVQKKMIIGVDDSTNFKEQKLGYVPPKRVDDLLRSLVAPNRIELINMNMGQVETSSSLILSPSFVRDAYERNKGYLHGDYRKEFHQEFTSRIL